MELDLFKKRVNLYGSSAEERIKQGKLKSLKGALYNSYQAETIILEDKKEFKCLINAEKETLDFDEKMISIPFKDKELLSGQEQETLKLGDVFEWKENHTHWMVLTQYLEEDAYFRGQIQKCDQQIQLGDKKYWVCLKSTRNSTQNIIRWNQKKNLVWNDLDNVLIMTIQKKEDVLKYIKRFHQIKIFNSLKQKESTFKIEGYNELYNSNVLNVTLIEDFENSIKEQIEEEKKSDLTQDLSQPYIMGPEQAIKYDIVSYEVKNFSKLGNWIISIPGEKKQIIKDTSFKLQLEIQEANKEMLIEYDNGVEKAQKKVKLISM